MTQLALLPEFQRGDGCCLPGLSVVTGQNTREQQAKPALLFALHDQHRLQGHKWQDFYPNHMWPHLFASFLATTSTLFWFGMKIHLCSQIYTCIQFSLLLIVKIGSKWRKTITGKYKNLPDTLDLCCLNLQGGLTEQQRSTEDLSITDMVLEWRSIDKLNKHPQQRDRKSRGVERRGW